MGLVPTGSSDPYALRRAALGIVKIILERKVPVFLSLAVGAAAKALLTNPPKKGVTPEQETQVLDFLLDRAKFMLREREKFSYDEVNAVFRAGVDDLVDAHKRLVALKAIRKSKNFEPLAVSFKRIRNILEKSNFKKDECCGDPAGIVRERRGEASCSPQCVRRRRKYRQRSGQENIKKHLKS